MSNKASSASKLNGSATALAGAFRKVIEEAIQAAQEPVISKMDTGFRDVAKRFDGVNTRFDRVEKGVAKSVDTTNRNMQLQLHELRKEFSQRQP